LSTLAHRQATHVNAAECFVAPASGRSFAATGDEVLGPLREWGYEPVVEREWRSSRGNRVQLAAIGVPG
jgi:hypothetical protein